MTDAAPGIGLEGPAPPPRRNGELVFDAPWESRAFGVALALHDEQLVDYEEFRARLIDEIGRWEATHGTTGEGYRYYERWAAALERAVVELGLVDPADVDRTASAIAHQRAHDHDHEHDHAHDHVLDHAHDHVHDHAHDHRPAGADDRAG